MKSLEAVLCWDAMTLFALSVAFVAVSKGLLVVGELVSMRGVFLRRFHFELPVTVEQEDAERGLLSLCLMAVLIHTAADCVFGRTLTWSEMFTRT